MTWSVQPATQAHALVLAAIHHAAFPPTEAWGPDAFALQLALPGVFGLLEPRGGMIVARVAADEAEVLTLAVLPEIRRHGLGCVLLRAAMDGAQLRGATTLALEVAANNQAGRALYEQAGFVPVGHRRRYYADGSDALVLRAAL